LSIRRLNPLPPTRLGNGGNRREGNSFFHFRRAGGREVGTDEHTRSSGAPVHGPRRGFACASLSFPRRCRRSDQFSGFSDPTCDASRRLFSAAGMPLPLTVWQMTGTRPGHRAWLAAVINASSAGPFGGFQYRYGYWTGFALRSTETTGDGWIPCSGTWRKLEFCTAVAYRAHERSHPFDLRSSSPFLGS